MKRPHQNVVITSGKARIERTVMHWGPGVFVARFAWLGTEEEPLPESWFCCSAAREGDHSSIQTTGQEYLTVEQAFVLGLAISMAIDWLAEEGEK